MTPRRVPLRMHTRVGEQAELPWEEVDRQLAAAGTYWVVARGHGHPHPRPVWGVWLDESLHLSLGSPVLRRELAADPTVTVHLDSGTDVVIVEGDAVPRPSDGDDVFDAYNRKYDYEYDRDLYGPLLRVEPVTVLAWRAAGPAGRDGFNQVGRWRYR